MVYIWNSMSQILNWLIHSEDIKGQSSFIHNGCKLPKEMNLPKESKAAVDDSCIIRLVNLWSLHISWLYSWLFYTLCMGFLKELVGLNKYILT